MPPPGETCRLIHDPPAAGDWNMAVDEALLAAVAAGGPPVLRFYRWAEPTLSLGYFQDLDERKAHAASRDCPCVRRASGGGAIVHDIELTYSLCMGRRHPLARDAQVLYAHVHDALVEALATWGVEAKVLQPPTRDPNPGNQPPFLCFQRRAPGDVVAGDIKIAGSAQRRRRGAVLQHGSVLLATSNAAPELPGIAEVASQMIDAEALAQVWARTFSAKVAWELRAGAISELERQQAARLRETRYGRPQWQNRR